jgi:ADP-L-glycero-D-manno-heptose 6-epimerase
MVVVTGGAGFIGSCFVKKLNDNGITDIIIVDKLGSDQKWKNLLGKQFSTIVPIEVFRDQIQKGVFGRTITSIIHMGACSTTTERNADYLYDNNVEYSKILATYAFENGCKFIYASSAATYGLGEDGYNDTFNANLKPLNMYGFSKHLFDCWIYANSMESKVIGLKYFNVFGPNEYHKDDMASMAYKAFNQIQSKGYVELFASNTSEYPDGGQVRDFIYIKDVVDAMWELFQSTTVKGIYNLGTGVARSWNDLISSVFHAMNKKVDIRYIPMPEHLKYQYQNYTQASMDLLRSKNIYTKPTTLEDAVTDYVQNYLMASWQYI